MIEQIDGRAEALRLFDQLDDDDQIRALEYMELLCAWKKPNEKMRKDESL